MFGYGFGELEGRPVSTLNAPTDRSPEETAAEIITAVERAAVWRGEVENVRKDGTRFWCWANVSAFDHPEHGKVWVSVQRDITEQKQADEALREAEERFRRVFEDGPVGIVMVDAWSQIIDVNAAFSGIVGYERDELIDRHVDQIALPGDSALDADLVDRLFSGEISTYKAEKRYRTKDARDKWVSLTAGAVRDSAGRTQYVLGIVEDIDQRKRSETLMRRENERLSARLGGSLVELQRSRARILASADQERKRVERDLHDGAQHRLVALRIRLSLAGEVLEKDPAVAAELIASLSEDVQAALEEVRLLAKGVYPSVLADHGLAGALRAAARISPSPATVRANGVGRYREDVETAVYFACTEALQNAAKHAPGSAITVLLEAGEELRFTVRDEGQGFSLADTTSGMGLANMRDRLEAVGGTLALDSAPGNGTTVVGAVPLV